MILELTEKMRELVVAYLLATDEDKLIDGLKDDVAPILQGAETVTISHNTLLNMVHQTAFENPFEQLILDELREADDKEAYRICDECDAIHVEGYYFEGGNYYCTDTCLYKNVTEEEYMEYYEKDDAYWTQWEC